jgi:hypothetical protein
MLKSQKPDWGACLLGIPLGVVDGRGRRSQIFNTRVFGPAIAAAAWIGKFLFSPSKIFQNSADKGKHF